MIDFVLKKTYFDERFDLSFDCALPLLFVELVSAILTFFEYKTRQYNKCVLKLIYRIYPYTVGKSWWVIWVAKIP